MKPLNNTIGAICAASLLVTPALWAQDKAATTEPPSKTTENAGKATKQMSGKLVRGNEILGAEIYNQSADKLGEISDVLLDENTGNISHALLDLGDRLVPVPYKHVQQSEKATEGYVVAVDKTKLDKAPGFKADAWPVFDDAWLEKNFAYYDLKPKMKGAKLVRLSSLPDSKLFNQNGEHIGEIKNTLVHPNSGKVAYAVISVGEYVGMGEKLTNVPFKLVRQSKGDSPGYVVNVEKAKLKDALYFEKDAWPNYADPAWNEETYRFYGVEPYWVAPMMF